ncbi:ribosome quality control complex subunit TCF25-like [Liolophura sinensis]|uniref:ribosome quality control complex subunit TCF25-like n=1 Tax=Liolophura sinensis TaxID=3198878 RepID=UPI003158DEA2
MSNRALRKLQGKSDIFIPELKDDSSEENAPDPAAKSSSKKSKSRNLVTNPFELLNDSVGEDSPGAQNASNNSDLTEETAESANQEDSQGANQNLQKKKKRRKKKGKSAAAGKEMSQTVEEDEIDASIREVNRLLGDLGTRSQEEDSSEQSLITSDMRSLLSVEHKNLIPDNEMRRIFGSRVVQAEQVNRRRNRNRPAHRSSWLATPKDSWPPMGKTGLSMSHQESHHGNLYFNFEHSTQYQQIQRQFWEAVDSLNHQNIVNILQLQPYHIDSLLQLSEVCRMSEDLQMSTELVERALYSFEVAFHPLFSLTQGTCRLSYRRPENRAFYIALFRHLCFVGQKGCYRTALEFCKLLLSLDPEGDPLCVLLMIDFYALKSQQFTFLVRMFEEWEAHRNLSQLPNFALSVPLAMFQLAGQNGQDIAKATEMLEDSVLMFPGVLLPLLEKCGVSPDSGVTNSALFGQTSQYSPDALKQLLALYVGRCWPCWKEPEVVAWLEQTVRCLLDKVENGEPRVEQYNTRRKTRYCGTPRNIYRHVLISEIKEALSVLPMEVNSGAVFSYDPLPPLDSIASYERPARRTRAQEDGYLSMFLRSLLPNFNPDEVAQEPEGAAGGEQGNNLRQGVGALMDAMRDLLNNIRPVDPPVENHQGEDGEQHDEPQDWD